MDCHSMHGLLMHLKKIAAIGEKRFFVDEELMKNLQNGRFKYPGFEFVEFANWVPDFASLDNISQHDYESEASGNDQDIHSINELQEEGEINDKKRQDCMGKKLDDDVEKDIEDCSNNVTEKCGVVNNNMSNNWKVEILEDHFDV
ncbi:hypothetical protein Tco_0825634 [Tanacetum coccineum]